MTQGALGAFGPLQKVASLRAQGALGAFGPLKKVASLRAQGAQGAFWAPEKKSLRSGIMTGIPQDGSFREPAKQNKTKQNTADSVVWTGNDSVSIRAVFCFV